MGWGAFGAVAGQVTTAIGPSAKLQTRVQARKSRDFNRLEAQKARKWWESMDSTRYQRTVADMRRAGLNPLMAFGGGMSPSSAPSGSPASSSASSGSSGSGQIDALAQLNAIEQNKNIKKYSEVS